MAACTTHSMTNHQHGNDPHHAGSLAAMGELLRTWRDRYRQRDELLHLSERDLNDVGVSWDDVAHEASKPFWRA